MTKPTKWSVRPAKTQISLGIRPVWSESSLSAWRNIASFCCPFAPLSALRHLWSDWTDAQADLSLSWAHVSFYWFCHAVAHLVIAFFFFSIRFCSIQHCDHLVSLCWPTRMSLFEPAHEILVLITKATSECSGEPAHPRSLTRAFLCSHTWSMEVDEGSDQKKISSLIGCLRMRVWRKSLRTTKVP